MKRAATQKDSISRRPLLLPSRPTLTKKKTRSRTHSHFIQHITGIEYISHLFFRCCTLQLWVTNWLFSILGFLVFELLLLHVCSFEDTDDEDQVKMHRSVSSDDVKEYSTGARAKDVKLQKEEDIEYRSGHLQHSSGVTSIKMSGSRRRIEGKRVELQEGPLSDKLLSANSSYSLDLLHCQKSPSSTRGRRRARKPMTRDSLKAVVSKGNNHSYNNNFYNQTLLYQPNNRTVNIVKIMTNLFLT